MSQRSTSQPTDDLPTTDTFAQTPDYITQPTSNTQPDTCTNPAFTTTTNTDLLTARTEPPEHRTPPSPPPPQAHQTIPTHIHSDHPPVQQEDRIGTALETVTANAPTWCKYCKTGHNPQDHNFKHLWCPFCTLPMVAARSVTTLVPKQAQYILPSAFRAHLGQCALKSGSAPARAHPRVLGLIASWEASLHTVLHPSSVAAAPRAPPTVSPPSQPPRLPSVQRTTEQRLQPGPHSGLPPPADPVPGRVPPAASLAPVPIVADQLQTAQQWVRSTQWIGLGPRPEAQHCLHTWEASRVAQHGQTLQAIPPDVLELWKDALTRWAQRWERAVGQGEDERTEALYMLLVAPNAALPKPSRGGARKRTRDIKLRIARWAEWVAEERAQEPVEEADPSSLAHRKPPRTSDQQRRFRRAEWLVPKGRIGKAAQTLEALSPLSATEPLVRAQLHKMFPARSELEQLPPLPLDSPRAPPLHPAPSQNRQVPRQDQCRRALWHGICSPQSDDERRAGPARTSETVRCLR